MRFRIWLGLAALALAGVIGARAEAEPRVALVIGNGQYGGEAFPKLEKAAGDAQLMAQALKKVGFQVLVVQDADQKQMKRAIVDFGELLEKGGPQATGLFFYTGHGLSVDGRGFMIPLDAHIARKADLSIEALTVDDIVVQMEFVANATNFIIIDWSYANPLSKTFRSVSEPVQTELPLPGFLLAYSGAPARDSSRGARSPYVTALAELLTVPGLPIHDVFDGVRKRVLNQTEGYQMPWEAASMTEPFFFLPKN